MSVSNRVVRLFVRADDGLVAEYAAELAEDYGVLRFTWRDDGWSTLVVCASGALLSRRGEVSMDLALELGKSTSGRIAVGGGELELAVETTAFARGAGSMSVSYRMLISGEAQERRLEICWDERK